MKILNPHKAAIPLVSLIYFVMNCTAYAQTAPNFDDLFDGLDETLTQFDDSAVYDSVDAAINPRVAEICGYIENGKRELIKELLLDEQHNFLKKQHGGYHSYVDFFSKFKCHQNSYGGLSKGGDYTNQFTPLELSFLHSKNSGIQTVSRMLVKLESLSKNDRQTILSSQDFHGETNIVFIEGLIHNYDLELEAVGIVEVNGNDPTRNQLVNIRNRLIKIAQETNQELRIAKN